MKNLRLWRDLHKARKRNIGMALIPAMVSTIVVVAPHAYAAPTTVKATVEVSAIKDGSLTWETTTEQGYFDPTNLSAVYQKAGYVVRGVYVKGTNGSLMRISSASFAPDGKMVIVQADTSGFDLPSDQFCSPTKVQVTVPNDPGFFVVRYTKLSENIQFSYTAAANLTVRGEFDANKTTIVPVANGSGSTTFWVDGPRDYQQVVTAPGAVVTEVADESTPTETRKQYEVTATGGQVAINIGSSYKDKATVTRNKPAREGYSGETLGWQMNVNGDNARADQYDGAGFLLERDTEGLAAPESATSEDPYMSNSVQIESGKNMQVWMKQKWFTGHQGAVNNRLIGAITVNGQSYVLPITTLPVVTTESDNAVAAQKMKTAMQANKLIVSPQTGPNAGMTIEVELVNVRSWDGQADLTTSDGIAYLKGKTGSLDDKAGRQHYQLEYQVKLSNIKVDTSFSLVPFATSNSLVKIEAEGVEWTSGDDTYSGALYSNRHAVDSTIKQNVLFTPNPAGSPTDWEARSEMELKRFGNPMQFYTKVADGYGVPTVSYSQDNAPSASAQITPVTTADGQVLDVAISNFVQPNTVKVDSVFYVSQGNMGKLVVSAPLVSYDLKFVDDTLQPLSGVKTVTGVNLRDNYNVTAFQPTSDWRNSSGVADHYQLVGVKDGHVTILKDNVQFGDKVSLRDINPGARAFTDTQGNRLYDYLAFKAVYTDTYKGAQLYWVTLHDKTGEGAESTSQCAVPAIPGATITVLQDEDGTTTPTKPEGENPVVVNPATPDHPVEVDKIPDTSWKLNPLVGVIDKTKLTEAEKAEVTRRINESFPGSVAVKDGKPVITVAADGTATVEFIQSDGTTIEKTFAGSNLVYQLPSADTLAALKLNPLQKVGDVTNLTSPEQDAVQQRLTPLVIALDYVQTKAPVVVVNQNGTADVTVFFNKIVENNQGQPVAQEVPLHAVVPRTNLVYQDLPLDPSDSSKLRGIELDPRYGVKNINQLTAQEIAAVAAAVKAAYGNPDVITPTIPAELLTVNVTDKGVATVTANTVDQNGNAVTPSVTIAADKLIRQLLPGEAALQGLTLKPLVGVDNLTVITSDEQKEVKQRIVAAYTDPQGEFKIDPAVVTTNGITIAANGGEATVTFTNGQSVRIPGSQLVYQKLPVDLDDLATIVANPRVGVVDKSKLTDAEKDKVKAAAEKAYLETFHLDTTRVSVTPQNDGSAVVTFTGYDAAGNKVPRGPITVPAENLVYQIVDEATLAQLGDAELNPRVEVPKGENLSADKVKEVTDRIYEYYQNEFGLGKDTIQGVVVDPGTGDATVTVGLKGLDSTESDTRTITLDHDQLIHRTIPALPDGFQLDPRVEVKNPHKLTDEEKQKVADEVAKHFDEGEVADIAVADDGSVTITFTGLSTNGTNSQSLDPEQVITTNYKVPGDGFKLDPLVEVADDQHLTDGEKQQVKDAVEALFPDATATVDDQGNVHLTYPDGTTTADLTPDQVIHETIQALPDGFQLDPRVEVKNPHKLTDEEKQKVADEVAKHFDEGEVADIAVADDGSVTITFTGLSTNGTNSQSLDPEQVITTNYKVPGDGFKLDPLVEVGDDQHLTDGEKQQVKDAVEALFPDATATVDDQGNVHLTYPDGTTTADLKPDQVIKNKYDYPNADWALNPLVPVFNLQKLTDAERDTVESRIRGEWPDGAFTQVVVRADGSATLIFETGVVRELKPSQLVEQASYELNYPDENWQLNPRVEVEDKNNLTVGEATLVENKVAAAFGSVVIDGELVAATKEVKTLGDGTTLVTFIDGKQFTLQPDQVVVEKQKPQTDVKTDLPLVLSTTSGRVISGTAPEGTVVTVTDQGGNEVAKVTVGPEGTFSIPVPDDIQGNQTLTVKAEKENYNTVTRTFVTTDVQKEEKAASSSDYLGWLWLIPVILGLAGIISYWAYVNQVDGGDRQPLQRGQANPADYIRWIQGLPARESGGLR